MSWTNERIELLQKRWLEGWSASRIAGELAHGFTRNGVIGKVYRLGLSGRAKALPGNVPASSPHQKEPRRAARQHANSPQVVGNTALALHPFVIEVAAPQTVRDVVIPISEPVTILELRESMCRWPIGDPAQSEFRFCGAKKLPGQGPYCACHAGIAYQVQHDRRRERRSQKRPAKFGAVMSAHRKLHAVAIGADYTSSHIRTGVALPLFSRSRP
jgi:GcrA cell cycle regulator